MHEYNVGLEASFATEKHSTTEVKQKKLMWVAGHVLELTVLEANKQSENLQRKAFSEGLAELISSLLLRQIMSF